MQKSPLLESLPIQTFGPEIPLYVLGKESIVENEPGRGYKNVDKAGL